MQWSGRKLATVPHCSRSLSTNLFSAVILEESNDDVQEDDCSDDTTLNVVVGTEAESHCDDKHQSQAVGDLAQEDSPPNDAARGLQLVGAILLMTTSDFIGRQAIPRK